MLDSPQHDTGVAELDADLLSTPFRVDTNWHVITGAPCSGKTTLIDQLAEKGFRTVAETARQYIERELARGRTLDEIFKSEDDECGMMDLQLRTEQDLRATDITFLDRAFPDCLSFYRLTGMNPNEILAECFHYCYASVFILNRFPLQLDGVRMEDNPAADYLDEWLARDYGSLGYDVVRVPVLPPQERLAFVLETLSEQELI
jgi:predicted ATPase